MKIGLGLSCQNDKPRRHVLRIVAGEDHVFARLHRLIDRFEEFAFAEKFRVVSLAVVFDFDGAFIAQDKFFDVFVGNFRAFVFDFEIVFPLEDASEALREFWRNRLELGVARLFFITTPDQCGFDREIVAGQRGRRAEQQTQVNPGVKERAHFLRVRVVKMVRRPVRHQNPAERRRTLQSAQKKSKRPSFFVLENKT